MYHGMLVVHAGRGDPLVAGQDGSLYLGATVSVGDMQRLREAAQMKQKSGKFRVMGRDIHIHALYNSLQAHGGAYDAVRHLTKTVSSNLQALITTVHASMLQKSQRVPMM